MIDMVVPCPVRLNQQIAGIHNHGLAIGGRVGSATLDDEAQSRVGVSMWRCCLSRKNDLKSHGDGPAACLQTDIAPDSIGAYPHYVCRFHERRINVRPAPELWFHLLGIVAELPISAHVQISELAIQFLDSPLISR